MVQSLSFEDQTGSNPKQSAWPLSWPCYLWAVGLGTFWVPLVWIYNPLNYMGLSSLLFSLFFFSVPLLVWNRYYVNNLREEDNVLFWFSLFFFLCQKEGGNSVRHKLALHQPLWPISSDVSKENSMALLRVLYSFMIRFSLTLFLVMKICSATPSHCFIGGI